MGFRFFAINHSFLSMHIAGGDYADQRFLSAKREYHVQHAAVGRSSERMKTWLRFAVPRIRNQEQRITKEHRFRFRLRNVMFLSALSSVPFVPVEAFNPIQCDHVCILP
jgi:hypothetical protein